MLNIHQYSPTIHRKILLPKEYPIMNNFSCHRSQKMCKQTFWSVVVVAILSVVVMVQAQDRQEGVLGGSLSIPLIRQQAEELRARAREAQELSDRLRRQADELDQVAKRQMDRGRGPQDMERGQRELAEIKDAIGRAEREGRRQDAAELRKRAEQLMGRLQPMQPGPGMDERQEIKGKVERLRNEARIAKEQDRIEDSKRASQEADRLEQQLREQGPSGNDQPGKLVLPEVLDILKAAEQAEREGRMDDARRQREKAEIVARQLKEQQRQSSEQHGWQSKDEIMRGMADLQKEIGRLWQAVNEMRNQLKEGKPM